MKRLLSIYKLAPLYKRPPEDPKWMCVPSWIKLQLRAHIGRGVTTLEAEVLAEMDHIMTAPEGLGKRNPVATWVATWVCLWVLILAYRSHIAFIYLYFREDDNCKYLYSSSPESSN